MASKSKPAKATHKSRELVISDQNGRMTVATMVEEGKHKLKKHGNALTERPPFNLDTHIDYDDDYLKTDAIPTKSTSKKRNAPESKKHQQQLHQEELNQQWADSLREEFHQKS